MMRTSEKRVFLVETFCPSDGHTLTSRDPTISSLGIIRITGDTSVDVVLNAMTGEEHACFVRVSGFV